MSRALRRKAWLCHWVRARCCRRGREHSGRAARLPRCQEARIRREVPGHADRGFSRLCITDRISLRTIQLPEARTADVSCADCISGYRGKTLPMARCVGSRITEQDEDVSLSKGRDLVARDDAGVSRRLLRWRRSYAARWVTTDRELQHGIPRRAWRLSGDASRERWRRHEESPRIESLASAGLVRQARVPSGDAILRAAGFDICLGSRS